ncbi:enoyl-CoA hydratase/isomerase family protein [Sphaerimonospora sp. CA-214678]|uniref:enoyl-CoA hydratase/isomerase family protein n=1 Tax=Sphaerimonospora sp. CA-214678 TaxID=3240029 RepID=UPI003D8C44ED
MDSVLIERRDAVATVMINRPERRNSLNGDVKTALRNALTEVAADQQIRAVVLAGAGGHFCAGQDLKEHADELSTGGAESAFSTVAEHYAPIVRSLATMPKPVIAAVEGSCVGAGLGFALACDLRVFAKNATLATAFSAIGLTCDSGLAHTLPRAVGDARARHLVLLAEPFTPAEAVRWGITGDMVDPHETLAAATGLAERLASGPTTAYAETKRLITETWTRTLDATLSAESRAQSRAGASTDHTTAVRAFLNKERPAFVGR